MCVFPRDLNMKSKLRYLTKYNFIKTPSKPNTCMLNVKNSHCITLSREINVEYPSPNFLTLDFHLTLIA